MQWAGVVFKGRVGVGQVASRFVSRVKFYIELHSFTSLTLSLKFSTMFILDLRPFSDSARYPNVYKPSISQPFQASTSADKFYRHIHCRLNQVFKVTGKTSRHTD